ncbi:MAG: hypothetical protein OEQ18_15925 [Gammaproteobacteria bacterium]|nr:hypothetical protein [Gammaproteobacteria bacterium]
MAGMIPSPNTLIKKDDDAGYIVGWKKKYAFDAGKFTDEVMTYGEAKKKAAKLNAQHDDKVFWPELLAANPHL